MRDIARRIHRAPSTVSREVARNGGCSRYRAQMAERRALKEARRTKIAKLAKCPRLRRVVESKLERRWSPQQIEVDPNPWTTFTTTRKEIGTTGPAIL
jgi:IS30 family transposase